MGNCAFAEVFDDDSHGRLVCETALLLVESEVCRMQVDDERRRMPSILLQDIRVGFD